MGVDLRLLPAEGKSDSSPSFDIIELNRNRELFEHIAQAERAHGIHVQPGGINSFSGKRKGHDDTCYGKTEETPYGDRMKSITAGQLYVAMSKHTGELYWKEKATIAFLKELPTDLRIYLYWH